MSAKILEFLDAQLRHEARQYAFDLVMYGLETALMRYGKEQTPTFKRMVSVELAKYGYNPEVQ